MGKFVRQLWEWATGSQSVTSGKPRTLWLAVSLWLALSGAAQAQVDSYTLAATQDIFTPLSNGTPVPAMAADTYLSAPIALGFNFIFDGATYSQVKASSNGWLTFATAATSNYSGSLAGAPASIRPLVAPLLDDLDGNPVGAQAMASYSTTGTAPNRVFTFEWLNWEWRWDANVPVLSFQVKLYEGSNRVEYVYRPEAGAPNATVTQGASIGLVGTGAGTSSGTYLALSDATAAPTASATAENTAINTKPAAGQVYAFSPAPLPACPPPRNLSVVSLTNTTASLAWNTVGSGTFSIQYGPAGFTPGSGQATTVTSATPAVTLMGLTAGTSYDFYVTQVCGGSNGNSQLSARGTFTTQTIAPPLNDECSGAVVLAGGPTCAATSGTLSGASATPGLSAPVGTADDEVWYRFVASAPAHTVRLAGSGDYVQQLLGGSCDMLTAVDYADPNEKTYTGLVVGTTYWVRVYSYAAVRPTPAAAAFTICLTTPPTAPANDACAAAVLLTPASNAQCGTATAGTVEAATGTTGLAAPTGTADDDVWYQFTAAATSHTVAVLGSGLVQELLTGACGSLVSRGYAGLNSKTYTGLTIGAAYYLRVYSASSAPVTGTDAAFTICVTTPAAILPPANDDCASAITLLPGVLDAACVASTSGTLEAATATAGLSAPAGTADDDVWYRFVATNASHTVTLAGPGEYVQQVLAGTCATVSSVAYGEAKAQTYTGLTVGTTYYLRVYSAGAVPLTGPDAAFTVCLTTLTPFSPPLNDECSGAVVLSGGPTCAATSGTLSGASATPGLSAPVGTADDEVWYRFVASAPAHTVRLAGSGDYVQQLLGGSCDMLTAVDYADPNEKTYTGLVVGTTYWVRVYSYAAARPTPAAAAFTICLTTPPANDEPCGAVAVPVAAGCASPTQGSTQAATSTIANGYLNPGCGLAVPPRDVWFRFTTPATGEGSTAVSVVAAGSPVGLLRVFSAPACTGPFSQVGCQASATDAGVTLALSGLTANTTYYVLVAAYDSEQDASGPFTICVTPPASCPAPVSLNASSVTLTSAVLGWQVAGGNGPFTVEYGPVGFTPGSGQGTLVATSAAIASLTNLTSGTTYQFYVTQNCGGSSGPSLRTGPARFTTLALPPANDDCASAPVLPVVLGDACAARVVGTTAGATASAGVPQPGCAAYGGSDVWYRVVVPASGNLIAETDSVSGSALTDTGLAVYTGSCGALTQLGCDDDGGNGLFSRLELTNRTPGEVLYLRVFEPSSRMAGRFRLCVRSTPGCPAPIGLNATALTTTSARLNWAVATPGANATFTLEYGPQGFVPGSAAGTRLTGLTGTFADVTGLNATTSYCYYVIQNCGSGGTTAGLSVAAGPVCFSTPPPVPANNEVCTAIALPINTACVPVSGNNFGATTSPPLGYVNPGCTTSNAPKDVWFVLHTAANTTNVQITTTGAPAGQVRIFTAAACSTALTPVTCRASVGNNQTVGAFDVALVPDTRYYVMVAGWGSNDATGAFTICAQQTTLRSSQKRLGGEVSVFPNPSNTGVLTLQIQGAREAKAAQATLLNALGQQVLMRAVPLRAGVGEASLPVSGLTGIYTLRVTLGDYISTRKVVLE